MTLTKTPSAKTSGRDSVLYVVACSHRSLLFLAEAVAQTPCCPAWFWTIHACPRTSELVILVMDRTLLLLDLRDWLPEEHLAWFVIQAIEETLDPSSSMPPIAPTATAAPRTSRDYADRARLRLRRRRALIESDRAPLSRDVAFRVITANQAPDHTTIARFRVRHQDALVVVLFTQVLGLCAEAGIVELGALAVDGTKLVASASNHANRGHEQIAAEILAEADRIDRAGDQVDGRLAVMSSRAFSASREGRRAWLREAKERLEEEPAAKQEPVPRERASGFSSAASAWSRIGAPSAG